MQSIRILSLLLAPMCVAAAQSPKVGDFATYDVKGKIGGEPYQITLTHLIEAKEGDRYLWVTRRGNEWESKFWVSESELGYIQDLNRYCVEGVLETVAVPAGSILACKEEYNVSGAWLSDSVPFGLVQSYNDAEDGETSYYTLIDYGW